MNSSTARPLRLGLTLCGLAVLGWVLAAEIVARCLEVGLVRGDNLSVDGDGHSFAYLGSTVWGHDVFRFLSQHCKQ